MTKRVTLDYAALHRCDDCENQGCGHDKAGIVLWRPNEVKAPGGNTSAMIRTDVPRMGHEAAQGAF